MRPVPPTTKTTDGTDKPPFLTVLTVDQDHTVYSWTSFATKLHLRLRHAGVPYVAATGKRDDAPKSKVPYVRFEEDFAARDGADGGKDGDGPRGVRRGELMGDSGLITARLVGLGKLPDVNAVLLPAERAQDYCLISMVEDKLYFFLVYERWLENPTLMRDEGPFNLPWGVRHVMGFLLKKVCTLMVYFQGTGRHSPEELRQLRREAIGALADYVRPGFEASLKKPGGSASSEGPAASAVAEPFWVLGREEPTEADFALFGYLAIILECKPNPFTRELIKEHKELVAYFQNIHNKYFPDIKNPLE